jgi:hypothetical protein
VQQSQRQDCPPLHGYAIVPSAFRLQVSPSTSGIFLEMPPDYVGDTSVRHMAHMRFCRRYRCCSSLRQGRAAHSSLGLVSGALVCSMLLTPLHSTRSDLRQHILGITPGLGFSDHPTRQMHTVGTCSCDRPSRRVICWLLRSDSPCSVAFRLLLSAGFRGGEYRSRGDMSAPIRVHFGPSPALACGYLR